MSLTNLTQWSRTRGFNYMPGYSAHLQYTWTHFDADTWEREVPWSLRFGTNMLRIWLDWGAFLAMGERMMAHLDKALTILDKNGIKMMPVLFNRWHDPTYPAGGICDADLRTPGICFEKFHPYLDAVLSRFADDRRIAMWDLCHHPQSPNPSPEVALQELRWLHAVASYVRQRSTIPLTIGCSPGENLATYAPLTDVISFHLFSADRDAMHRWCQEQLEVAEQLGKPLICTACCIGSLDDEERAQIAKMTITALEQHSIGWLAWQLVSGPFVTGSRKKTNNNGIRRGEGYMPFVLRNGGTRPGHEWLVQRDSEYTGSHTVSVIRPPYKTEAN